MDYFTLVGHAKEAFVKDGEIIDFVNPWTGRSAINGETLEQVNQRYPGAIVMEKEAAYAAYDAALKARYIKAPSRITEKDWWYALEQLPPLGWVNHGHTESFKCSEMLCGSLTAIYARVGDNYFELCDYVDLTHAQIIDMCKAA